MKGNTAQKQIAPRELISALAAQVKRDYDIEISVEQVLSNAKYRLTVLHELRTLDDQDINTQLDTLMHSYSGQSSDAKNALAPVVSDQSNKLVPLVAMICLTLIVIAVLYFFAVKDSGQQLSSQASPHLVSTQKQQPIQASQVTPQPTTQVTETNTKTKAPLESDAMLSELPQLPIKNPEMVFRLHGSNTIGEKLAPALVEAFFKKQGVENFTWVAGDNNVERTVQFIADGKVQAVELHAHGSGTAFKDMLNGAADLGMASRPIKEKELAQSKTALGDLSRVGNEHIIGLDGLAVIVNQNSPLKSMSLNTLAKIFAGEVTNWAQIGQGEGEIKLFARDANSGTWDTFNKLVLKKTGKELNTSAERFESSSQLSEQVSIHEHAIGFIGLNYIGHNKALAITEGNGATPIFPTKFTVGTEDYALSRRLYLYTPTAASPVIKDFAQFAIGKEGQELVDQVGLISQNIRLQKVYPSQGAPRSYNNYTNRGQRLSLNFRFNQGNGDLDNKGQRDLLRLIDFIEQNPGRRIVLMGFSDSSGAQASNRQLSYRRAKAVEKELVARGIAVMAVEAYGELLPVANNNTNAGRERNRRVEVWVI